MAIDLLERLREADVPDVPVDIDERIHQRLNTSLTVTHLVDFVCQALPATFAEFAKPLGELVRQSVTPQNDSRN
jgi:hypothetical protein